MKYKLKSLKLLSKIKIIAKNFYEASFIIQKANLYGIDDSEIYEIKNFI